MTTKSTNLNNTIRTEVLSLLHNDLRKSVTPRLVKLHKQAGRLTYNALYDASLRRKLNSLPRAFWNESDKIEVGGVTDWSIKDRANRNQERALLRMPAMREAFDRPWGKGTGLFRRHTDDNQRGTVWCHIDSLPIGKKVRQHAQRLYMTNKIEQATMLGLVAEKQARILAEQLAGIIQEARFIVDQAETAFIGAAEILINSRTVGALHKTWPESKKYLKLEKAMPAAANIVPVAVTKVNQAMASVL